MVLDTDLIIAAPGVRMSILAMGLPMRPYTLTQTVQNTVKSSCKRGGPYVQSFSFWEWSWPGDDPTDAEWDVIAGLLGW